MLNHAVHLGTKTYEHARGSDVDWIEIITSIFDNITKHVMEMTSEF